jgi:hypothetical protein
MDVYCKFSQARGVPDVKLVVCESPCYQFAAKTP